jgi:hypothetical protein
MFALSTMYWISGIVLIFRHVDYMNSSIKACYGRDIGDICLGRELSRESLPPAALLATFDSMLLVNVSTVQIQRASCPRIICKHPRELTHLL